MLSTLISTVVLVLTMGNPITASCSGSSFGNVNFYSGSGCTGDEIGSCVPQTAFDDGTCCTWGTNVVSVHVCNYNSLSNLVTYTGSNSCSGGTSIGTIFFDGSECYDVDNKKGYVECAGC
jgi:hypothetical protein